MSEGLAATLTVVGAGTLLPHPDRGSASFHLQVEGETPHSLLMDAGSGTLHGLPRAGVEWRAIDTVALTHFHPDHLADLAPLLAAYRYEGLEAPLTLLGPFGLRHRLEAMASLYGSWIFEPSRPLTVVELEPGAAWSSDDGAVRLVAHDTPHTPESVAYRVTIPAPGDRGGYGHVVGYTGDTGPSRTLGGFLTDCDLLVAECALTDPPEIDTHLGPEGVARLACDARPELLLVSHVYPPQTPREAAEAVRRSYPGRVEAAQDGVRVRMTSSGVAMDRLDGRA